MKKFYKKYMKIFSHKQFRKKPTTTLIRIIIFIFLDFFKIKKIFIVNHHKFNFKFTYLPSMKMKSGGRGIFLFREKIEDLMEFGHKFINKNDHCIDGGANQGIFSLCFASAVGPEGRVIAVEPFEYCIKNLRQNIILNNFQNIDVCQKVLFSKSGLDKKLDYSIGVGGASIVRDFGSSNYLSVKSITIDEIVEKYHLKLNFLKLDIEGAELDALKGSIDTLEKNKPIICLEGDPKNYLEISEYLKKLNYSPFYFENKKLQKLNDYKPLTNIFFLD